MAQRSAVSQLPEGIRQELEQRLVRGGFAGYAQLADWLSEQGFEISRSSIHRYGQQFESRLQALRIATDQAKAIAGASADDEGAMNEALIRLVQTKTFEILRALDEDDTPENLPKIGRMVADLARASISQKKWAEQTRAKVAAAADEFASRNGLTATQAEDLRRELLGVVA
ncbi:MAG TPA: DUF3486 family protein [Gammaproteobacteria bacterium]|nr:DUF3486 family protein [Gammaproteobacteria bacterium]